jgi:hypothetical protein
MKLGGERNIHSLKITSTQVFLSEVEVGGICALKYEEEAGSLGKLTLVLHVDPRNTDISLPDFDPAQSEIIIKSE